MNRKWSATRYWGDRELPTAKADFFNVVTTLAPGGDDAIATIRIFGPIDSWGGFWGVSAKDVSEALDGLPATVTGINVRLNSPGGEVFEALAILNLLRAHKATITAVVDGLAASAASVIAAAADETVMSPGTQLMIHSPLSFDYGNATELRKTAEVLDSIEASLIEIYQAKAGDHDWTALLADETWFTAAQAVELGLADRVAVIPDAGEAVTAGGDDDDEPTLVVVPLEADDTASTSARGLAYLRSKSLPAASGQIPNRKEPTVSDTIAPAVQPDSGATEEPTVTAAASDTVLVDREAFTEIQTGYRDLAAFKARKDREDREQLVDDAIKAGKFAASRRDHFLSLLELDPEGTAATIAELEENVIPVAELGFDAGGDTVNQTDQDAAFDAFASRMGIK